VSRYIVYVFDEARGEYRYWDTARYTSELVRVIERLTEQGVRAFAIEVRHEVAR